VKIGIETYLKAMQNDMRRKADLEVFGHLHYICIGNNQQKGTATVPFSFLHTRRIDQFGGVRGKTAKNL
jgi:hypothetical protein